MKKTFILGVGLLINMVVHCQQHKFAKVKANSTLLSSEIIDLMQDQDGFIWVASSEGLGRYDGHDVVVDEPPDVLLGSPCSSESVLQRRQRADPTEELDCRAPEDTG